MKQETLMKKLSNSTKGFLDYGFKGDGKYYKTEAGSRYYRNTMYGNFSRLNPDCTKVINSGNDAPRGGQTGNYDVVKFIPAFLEKYGWYFEEKKIEAKEKEAYEAEIKIKITSLGDQAENLRKYFKERPGKAKAWDEKTNKMSSSKWRSWVKMKAASKVADDNFGLLTLAPAEILKIMREFI